MKNLNIHNKSIIRKEMLKVKDIFLKFHNFGGTHIHHQTRRSFEIITNFKINKQINNEISKQNKNKTKVITIIS